MGATKVRLALVLAVLVTVVVLFATLPVTDYLISSSDWLQSQGFTGVVVVILTEALWITVCLPSTPIELLIGSTYGFGWGFVIDCIGKTSGCVCSFGIGRTVGREPVSHWLERSYSGRGHRLLKALSLIIATQGWRIVLPFRFAYIPMAIKNYGLSVCTLDWFTFTWTMLVSGTVMSATLVYTGSTARNLVELLKDGRGDTV